MNITYDDLMEYKKQFPHTSDETIKNLLGLQTNCINKQCARCGQCCTELIPLTHKEVKRIKEYLSQHPEIEPTEWIKLNKVKDIYDIAVLCPFLSEDMHTCKIYEVRPKICKTFKCSNKIENIVKNKEDVHKTAYYNAFNKEFNVVGKTYSTFEIFYGDKIHTVVYIIAETLRAIDYRKVLEKEPNLYKYIKKMFSSLGRDDIANDEDLVKLSVKVLKKFLKEMNINVEEGKEIL